MTQNNAGTKKRPPPVAGFKKGKSGNPGGRPKKTAQELDLVAACKAKTPAALEVIEQIMIGGESERNKLTAAMAIIERAYGKPAQPIVGDEDKPLVVEIIRFGKNQTA